MTLFEPQRGQSLLYVLNSATFNSPVLVKLVPLLADVFVFTYPLLLVIWYCTGIVKNNQTHKSDALTVLFSAGYATIIGMIIQSIWHKDRPIFSEQSSVNLILNELPTAAFPSDHAAVSMVIGLVVALIAFKYKNKLLKSLSLILVLAAIIMSISRVAVGVHWPTDIIAGWGVAIIVASLLSLDSIQRLQQQYINTPIIRFQERLFDITGITKILPK